MSSKRPVASPPDLYEMAQMLKLERRLHPRVKLPLQSWPDFSGPRAEWDGHFLPLHDISEGGACLDDAKDVLGSKIGKELSLILHIGDQRFEVPSRVVSTNISKRHVQFQSAVLGLREAIREWVQLGLRGQWIKQLNPNERKTLPILWASIYNDSLSLSEDPRWQYVLGLEDGSYSLSADFWPVNSGDLKPVSVSTFDKILATLENLPFSDDDSMVLRHSLHLIRRRSFE